jgi:isopenicillin-N N-acyltransferase-like protein
VFIAKFKIIVRTLGRVLRMLDTRLPSFGVVEFAGSAHERGFQYGEKFAENISEMLDRSYDFYKTAASLSRDQILKTASKFWPFIEEYSDEIAQELKGLSEGSKRKIEEITLLASFNEIQFYYAFEIIPFYGRTAGCTSFCVTGEATVDGQTIIGQNNDGSLHPNLDEYDFLMKMRTDSGIDFLTLTLMGCTAFVGVNSKGIGLCINAVSDGDFRVGVPFSVITRGILGSKTIGDAINAVITAERGAGANYLIADENGECYDIETTARNFNYFYIDKSLGHANHYLKRTTDQRNITPRRTDANTIVRCNRMNKLLEKDFGKITVDTCFGILKDHVNYPTSICVHPNPDLPPEMAMKTMDSIVISPANRELHVTRDNPCKTNFKKYSLQ